MGTFPPRPLSATPAPDASPDGRCSHSAAHPPVGVVCGVGEADQWKGMGVEIRLVRAEEYRMRSSSTYPGDVVQRRVREFNGKRFEFTRIAWGDGSVTLWAYEGRSSVPFREVTRCGGWQTDPVYLGECAPEPVLSADPGPGYVPVNPSQWEKNETALP